MSRDNWFTAPAGADPRHGRVLVTGNETRWCDACRLIHHIDLPCAVVLARVQALCIEIDDELSDDGELAGCDRIALLSALRLRGISLQPEGEGLWRAVQTVEDSGGVPVHVEDDGAGPVRS